MYAILEVTLMSLPTFTHCDPLWRDFLRVSDIGCVRRPLAFGTYYERGIPTIVGNPVRVLLLGASGGIFE